MGSNQETGHAVNVGNTKQLITACTYMGAPYNPPNTLLKLTEMGQAVADADDAMASVATAVGVFNFKLKERSVDNERLDSVVTQSLNLYESLNANPVQLTLAKSLARKIHGRRAKPKATPTPDGSVPSAKEISAAQTGFDNRVSNFDSYIEALAADPAYQAVTGALSLTALRDFRDDLKAKDTAVDNAQTALKNARALRDAVLYHPETGIVPRAMKIKKYVLSVFGTKSSQYAQVKGIRFRMLS